ncbi:hypothetical protein [uncultured Gammaproteobacteria bacterium]|nr:hypothetical protein [uncultured Gammaproteobacteria bacterium]
MARKGSGLGIVIKIIKALNRAQKQSARESERRRKQEERDATKLQREYERNLREIEKERRSTEKLNISEEKKQFKKNLGIARLAFDNRCRKRKDLLHKFIDQKLK